MRSSSTFSVVVLVVVAMLAIGACSSSSSSAGATAGTGTGTAVTVADAWVRPPMSPGLPAAGYLTITGGSAADALVSAKSPIAGEVQIHETMAGGSGMTGMQPVDKIDVPAGATVKLEPGGYHLMLMNVTEMPAVGSTVQLTLTFEGAGDVVVQAEVKAG